MMVAPLLGVDPAMAPESEIVACRIGAVLAGMSGLVGRAEKFAVSFDLGGVIGLGEVGADIAIRATGSGWDVDGAACGADDVVGAVQRRLDACAPALRAGLRPELVGRAGSVRVPPLGFLGYAAGRGAFGLGLMFGAMDAALLGRLADLAVAFGDGVLRFTPWRAVVIAGVAEVDAALLAEAADGLVVTGGDWRLGVQACVGAPFCAAAGTATRADARALGEIGAGVHVSGCAKGCAHLGAMPVTLVGRDGRYDLVRNGRAGDAPVRLGLDLAAIREELSLKVPA